MQDEFKKPPSGIKLVLTRFICATFLHMSLCDEIRQGFNMMKYAQNHPWKFHSWSSAWFVGFAQTLVLISVEAVNLAVLLTNQTIMDTLMNFLALVIISDFDDYFFAIVKHNKLSQMIVNGEV